MTRETPQFGLRMPADLREQIEKEAGINGRSINAEIIARLRASLGTENPVLPASPVAMEPASEWGMSDSERAMLALFRRWSAEKQLSFLVLFK